MRSGLSLFTLLRPHSSRLPAWPPALLTK